MAESSAPKLLWQPDERAVEEAQVTQFARQVIRKRKLDLNTYPDFYRWTVDSPEEFWTDVWDFCGVVASRRGNTVLADGNKMPGAHWFPEARLNFAENLMRRGDRGDAFVLWDETGFRRRLSFSDLTSDVSRAEQALRALGLRAGDRAAAFIPNIPEAGMLALAATSQGMVWSSCSPDFGVDGVLERFGQIEPKVLFCADGYRYNGEEHDSLERVREIAEKLPTVRKIVVVPHLDPQVDVSDVPKAVRLDEWLRRYTPGEIAFAQLPFNHPVFVLFSSGEIIQDLFWPDGEGFCHYAAESPTRSICQPRIEGPGTAETFCGARFPCGVEDSRFGVGLSLYSGTRPPLGGSSRKPDLAIARGSCRARHRKALLASGRGVCAGAGGQERRCRHSDGVGKNPVLQPSRPAKNCRQSQCAGALSVSHQGADLRPAR
jgi:hypothetical protein